MRVLIAEDEKTSRNILELILRKWGYEPIVACDGEESWQALQKSSSPMLVILDWMMPKMTGIEVCKKLRKVNTTSPHYIILLTGMNEKADIVLGLEAGANDFITKPYSTEELKARIGVGARMLELQAKLQEAIASMAYQAMHDSLTGLLNRRAIFDVLEKELARAKREKNHFSIGMCDIDKFKKINDKYGHLVGDEVLRQVAKRLSENLRSYDHVGRYGGEEFLLITPGFSGNAVKNQYIRLQTSIQSEPFHCDGIDLPVTISIGVANSEGRLTADEILTAADGALFEAKRRGRDCVVFANGCVPPTE